MPTSVLFAPEFTGSNASRKYPLAYTATAEDASGVLRLPSSILTHLWFPIPADLGINPDGIYLREFIISELGLTIRLGYDDAPIALATIERATHIPYKTYPLVGFGAFRDCRGTIGVGIFDELDALANTSGPFIFDVAGGRLDPDCVCFVPMGVRALTIRRADGTENRLQGDIELVSGPNIAFGVLRTGVTSTVRIDAIPQAGMVAIDDGEGGLAPPIRTINGQSFPGGHAAIGVDTCITLSVSASQLTFSNPCSDPCCGCADAAAIHDVADVQRIDIQDVSRQVFMQQNQLDRLYSVVTTSGLATQSCVTCED